MEIKIKNGDYVADGLGGISRLDGGQAVLQRVLYRLTARRGQFPLLPELGSRLYLLEKEPAAGRTAAARQYVAEALAPEEVRVNDVLLSPGPEGSLRIEVLLEWRGTELYAALNV